jgi:uncharacterized membrane protein YhhN
MPFAGGIEGTANGALILSVAAAVIYATIVNTRPTPLRTAAKALAVGLLAALTFVENGPPLLFGALVLSACGDAFLSREGDRMFLAGLTSFLASHLFYVALFVSGGSGIAHVADDLWRMVLAGIIVLAALVMLVLLWRRVKPALRLPILAYELAVLAMGLATLTLDRPAVVVGALMFMLSDALLATERFVISAISPHRAWLRHAVWVLYYLAQLIITLSFLLR